MRTGKPRKVPFEKSLMSASPELAEEWDSDRNPLQASEVATLSNALVYWVCKNNIEHRWSESVAKRFGRGYGCPYCSGKRVSDTNALSKVSPMLASQWEYEKNGNLTPDNVSYMSHKLVWWKCDSCNQSWDSTVKNRYAGNGCPYCANRKVYSENSLATKRPDLAKTWHPTKNDLTPDEVTEYSNQYAWWICNYCNHEWKAAINSRSAGRGCPDCALKYQTSEPEQTIYFYMKSIFNEVINRYVLSWGNKSYEADIFIPELNLAIEYDGYLHNDKDDRDEQKNRIFLKSGISLIRVRLSTINEIVPHGSKVIIHEKRDKNYHSLKQCILQIGNFIIQEYAHKLSSKTLNKIAELNNIEISNDIEDIHLQYMNYLNERSLSHKFPNLLNEWDYQKNKLSPEQVSAGTRNKAYWICSKCKYSWKASVVSSASGGRSCTRCAGKVADETNSISVTHPHLLEEWDNSKNIDLEPTSVIAGSDKYADWLCKACGHSWSTKVKERALNKTACPKCKVLRVKGSRGLLIHEHPEIAMEWHPTKNPESVEKISSGSSKNVWWLCKEAHEYQRIVIKRVGSKSLCPKCKKIQNNI